MRGLKIGYSLAECINFEIIPLVDGVLCRVNPRLHAAITFKRGLLLSSCLYMIQSRLGGRDECSQ